jgi:hypothetical protein
LSKINPLFVKPAIKGIEAKKHNPVDPLSIPLSLIYKLRKPPPQFLKERGRSTFFSKKLEEAHFFLNPLSSILSNIRDP